jgi:cellulose synthase/poly-beta-1,6-N-acetylglucosamine synthase-like glycosyltransferase
MYVAHEEEVSVSLQAPVPFPCIICDRQRHRVARGRLQFAAVLVGVGVLIAFLGILLLTGVLLLISSFPLVASLASVLFLVAFFLVSFLLVSFFLVLALVAAFAGVLLLGVLLFTSVLLFVAALALVASFPFILVLALARRVQPRLPRDDERVLVGVLVYLITVQVVRGQIVLVVVGFRAERQGVVPVRPALSADRGRGDGLSRRAQPEVFRAGTNASNCSKV